MTKKLSKSQNDEAPAVTAEDHELKLRAEQALAGGYSLACVDAKALIKFIEDHESKIKKLWELHSYIDNNMSTIHSCLILNQLNFILEGIESPNDLST